MSMVVVAGQRWQLSRGVSTAIPGLDGADDEDSKIKALVNTHWNNRGVKCGKRYGTMGFGLDKKTPYGRRYGI